MTRGVIVSVLASGTVFAVSPLSSQHYVVKAYTRVEPQIYMWTGVSLN